MNRTNHLPEALRFDRLHLGENLSVLRAVLPSGVHLVWYRGGFPGADSPGPHMGIFGPNDKEYIAPILIGGSFSQACEFLHTLAGDITLSIAAGELRDEGSIEIAVAEMMRLGGEE